MNPPGAHAARRPDAAPSAGPVEVAWIRASGGWSAAWDDLDPAERARAGAFRAEGACRLYVAARRFVRAELGRRLGIAPAGVRFEAGPRGKPRLAAPWASSGWEFNLSHAGDLVVLAVARGRAVGIDVERLDAIPREEMPALAARHFSAGERGAVRRASGDADGGVSAFLRAWTRKEAVLKAAGEGLVDDLASVDTSSEPVRGTWTLRPVPVPEGYVGWVAGEGGDWELVGCGDPVPPPR